MSSREIAGKILEDVKSIKPKPLPDTDGEGWEAVIKSQQATIEEALLSAITKALDEAKAEGKAEVGAERWKMKTKTKTKL